MKTSSAYLRWLAGRLREDSQPVSSDPRQGCGHVIGQATGYSAGQIAPFVRSLRACFDGAVTLIVDDDPEIKAFLDRHQVKAIHQTSTPGWSPHVVVSRIALFDTILSHSAPDAPALLTDVRDVVFQADPLWPRPRTVEAFDEQDGQVFSEHALNRKYVGALVGGDVRAVLDAKAALCVGTIVGPVADLRRLCRILLMLCAVPRSELGGAFGADQAAFNLAVHLGLVEAEVQDNFRRVATVGVPKADRMTVVGGEMVNPDGTVSPIVHQYDRHPHLRRHVNERWNVATVARPRRHGPHLADQVRKLNESVRKRVPETR